MKNLMEFIDAERQEFLSTFGLEFCGTISDPVEIFTSAVLWVLGDGREVMRNVDASGRRRYEKYISEYYNSVEFTPEVILNLPNDLGPDLYTRLRREVLDRYGESISISGYYPDSGQWSLQIAFDQRVPFESQLRVLDFVEFLKPVRFSAAVDREYGILAKVIKVQEHTLAEHGIYSILIVDGVWRLIKTTYSLSRTLQIFNDPLECLRFIYLNHPSYLKDLSN